MDRKQEVSSANEDAKIEVPKSTPVPKKKSQKDSQSAIKKPLSPHKLPEAHFQVINIFSKRNISRINVSVFISGSASQVVC